MGSNFNNTYTVDATHLREFAAPGIPWVTSSVLFGTERISLPFISRCIAVKNDGPGTLYVAFTSNGLRTNYFKLYGGQTYDGFLRVKELHLSGTNVEYAVIADLTGLVVGSNPTLSSSLGHGGVG